MTGNEAKEWIEYLGNKDLPYDRSPISRKLACDMAIQALEEIQQYRAIGTVEELAQLKSEYNRVLKFNDRQGKIIDEYESIGTIEEFRALKEKTGASKKVVAISLTHEGRVGNCPNCNNFVAENYDKKCPKCRLKLDWQ